MRVGVSGLDERHSPAAQRAADKGIENCIQMTLGVANGETLYCVRYSTEGNSRTLYYSESMQALRNLFPDHPRAQEVPLDARAVVSEPLSDIKEAWLEVPESTALIVAKGEVETRPFNPHLP